MKHVSTLFSYVVLLASSVMFVWGALGLLEYGFGFAPLMPLQNANFPPGTQLIHWILIVSSGAVYLGGYATRWRYTPSAMTVLFAMLATLCAVETFDFMTRPDRYSAFGREVVYYVLIAVYLQRSKRMRSRFGRSGSEASPADRHDVQGNVAA